MTNFTHYLKISLICICLLGVRQVFSQGNNGSIAGVISTSDNQPASAVSVGLKEINKSAITNDKGAYLIKHVKPGS
jgi:iron complex outermembrane recepter protein